MRYSLRASTARRTLIIGLVLITSLTAAPAGAGAHSRSWRSYVLGPATSPVTAVRAEGRGAVTHPESLVRGHGRTTTLTTTAGSTPASVLLDFGKDIAGTPYVDIAGVSGAATLQLVTGEARQYLRRPAATTTAADAAAGDVRITVASAVSLEIGNTITFGGAQPRTITGFDSTARTIDLDRPLDQAVAAGAAVVTSPGAPASDESRGLAGVGGPDTLQVTAPGRITGGFHGGFRFVLLTLTTPGTIALAGLGVDFQAYRATARDYRGWFFSSDDQLNRMWYSGAYTLQLNMKPAGLNGLMDERIYDGAKRDRSIWTGDLLVQGPTILSTLGDVGASYLKSSLEALFATQRADGALPGSPDFAKRTSPAGSPLFYSNNYSGYGARAAIDYYRYTGDRDYIVGRLPNLRRELAYNDTFLTAGNLVASNDRDFWQATQTGEVTKYSIDYYILLREMAWLERTVGSSDAAAADDAKADAIKTAVNARLWNPTLDAYGQSTDHPDVLVEDANALALQYDFVPADRRASVLRALSSLWTPYGAILGPGLQDPTGHTIEPFGNGMETAGRFAAGDVDGALALMRRTWGPMVDPSNPLYTGGLWEFKNNDGGVNRATASLAHGWAASPTVQLTQQVLGVSPVGAGYATWSIQPRPGRLAWAEGVVPTRYGDISARWTSSRHRFDLSVTAPRTTSGTIAVPATRGSTILDNGRVIHPQITGGYARIDVPGGSHTITVLHR
ncbi:alpha-L-rhamnosidase C-terminal domain-containing protein [Paractinoplanes globisporus]|uniref:Alpha-L-rhamnosidase C-terminal domain-containing protein n=1 Tax=Paractinoplanes globisporus TaxID=113565 RepID=A0ABW6W9H9_9ACTN|nr:alpha-L-rhamnosidase C-terminal domain-containing protein [Actinoplanes globisporus]